jgi:hypothetical protein
MNNPDTFTAEHRSWEWELVLRYEDGSLPVAEWNPTTLAVIAKWYAKTLPREQATARYSQHYQRNRRRFLNRLDSASVDTAAIEAADAVWESLLAQALEGRA